MTTATQVRPAVPTTPPVHPEVRVEVKVEYRGPTRLQVYFGEECFASVPVWPFVNRDDYNKLTRLVTSLARYWVYMFHHRLVPSHDNEENILISFCDAVRKTFGEDTAARVEKVLG